MSDGMSDYWRARRAQEHEQKIKRDLLWIIKALLDNSPSPNLMIVEIKKMIDKVVNE